ncbi:MULTISPECIES: hypothetical protein [unclassified Nonomuraea]|uniref:hypothetical protein n=1 Tax=unclassified Nonomuraea TaxID=2593643 RepID=UPI0035BF840E
MNHRLTRVLAGLGAAGVVLTAQPAPASAGPTSWKWGALHSTDGMATARGKVVVGQSGLVVTGYLDDTYGKGCSWVLIKYQNASNGRRRTHGVYNCTAGTGSFRKSVGGVLQIWAQVCRGTSKRPVGRCSRWKTIYTQGG